MTEHINPLSRLNADWMEVHSVQSFQRDVDPNFEWKGVGWYPGKNGQSTLFVSFGRLGEKGENLYEFYVYDYDPRQLARRQFEEIISDRPWVNPMTDGLDDCQ